MKLPGYVEGPFSAEQTKLRADCKAAYICRKNKRWYVKASTANDQNLSDLYHTNIEWAFWICGAPHRFDDAAKKETKLDKEMAEAAGLDIRQLVQDLTDAQALLNDQYHRSMILPDPYYVQRQFRLTQARAVLGMSRYPYKPKPFEQGLGQTISSVPVPVEAPPTPSLQDKLNSLTERVYRLEHETTILAEKLRHKESMRDAVAKAEPAAPFVRAPHETPAGNS